VKSAAGLAHSTTASKGKAKTRLTLIFALTLDSLAKWDPIENG
jgi:hypothetical protein